MADWGTTIYSLYLQNQGTPCESKIINHLSVDQSIGLFLGGGEEKTNPLH